MNLKQLRKKLLFNNEDKDHDIKKILIWFKKRAKEDKTKVRKVPINNLKDWKVLPNGNVFHKSKQFFSL